MRVWLLCAIAALLILCAQQPSVTHTAEIIFKDDFEQYKPGERPKDLSLVEVVGGSPNNFTVVDYGGNKALMIQLRGFKQLTDVLLIGKKVDEFNLKFDLHEIRPYDAVPALVFGFSGESYYLVTYNEYAEKAGKVKLYNVVHKNLTLLAENVAALKTLQDDEWHTFNVTVEGDSVIITVDGLEFISSSIDIREGYVGFANSDGSLGKYLIDNVVLSKPRRD